MTPSTPANPLFQYKLQSLQLSLFGLLWALSAVFHQGHFNDWASTPADTVLTLSIFWLLLKPSSFSRFLIFIAAEWLCILYRLPRVSNHWLFTFFAATTILTSLAAVKISNLREPLGWKSLCSGAAPVMRILLLILYFFATFHKINSDYFDIDRSCGTAHYMHLAGRFAFLPVSDFMKYLSIFMTLIIEGGIPVLLFIRRTRAAGVLLAAVFHLILGLNDYYDFTAMLYGILILFLPPAAAHACRYHGRRFCRVIAGFGRRAQQRLAGAGRIVLILMTAGALFISRFPGENGERISFWVSYVLWAVFSFGFIMLLAVSLRRPKIIWPAGHKTFFLFTPRWLAVIPALFILNALSPYLGLKTETSLAMYSNLRTEGSEWNHLLVPKNVSVFGYQRDLVRILESNHRRLRALTTVPYFSLRNQISTSVKNGKTGLKVTYERAGKEERYVQGQTHPELEESYPLLLRKFMVFRAIADPQTCRH